MMSINVSDLVQKLSNGSIDFSFAKLKTAYALNLCTVSVSQIIDYDDVVILEQEYESILNNINIEHMPKDEALLKILKQLLDTITFFRIQEGDKQFIERDYQNKMKNAIWSAVPNLGLIMAGGNPVTMTVSLAAQVGIGYMNYRKAKAENQYEHEKNMWQLHRAAIEQFNGLRRELFDTAWRLVTAYDIPDEYRLTERQVKQYNDILMDPDDYRKYERLDSIKEYFLAYPPFWYFFGNTANALYRKSASAEEADYYLQAAKTYYEIFVQEFTSCNLLRENQVASACALEYIDLLRIDVPEEKKKISELLDFAMKMSGGANDVFQLCAFAYLKLGENAKAAVLLRRLVNEDYNSIVNAQLLSGYYVGEYLAGNEIARSNYSYLKDHVDENYLFPFPEKLLPDGSKEPAEKIQSDFIKNQKLILIKKFGLVINQFREKYRVAFNRCVPVPENKQYTDKYFDNSLDSFAARKNDGLSLKEKKGLSAYISLLQEVDYPYNYLNVLNSMLNDVSALDCVQGRETELVTSVSNVIIDNHDMLKELSQKIVEGVKFTADNYEEIIEISFDAFTDKFFEKLIEYSSEYIEQKNDIISMNTAEHNLREFCLQQGFSTPDVLFETANDVDDSVPITKQYLGIELIDDGVPTADVNDCFNEIKEKIRKASHMIEIDKSACRFVMSGEEDFDKYFIRLGSLNKRDIRRKTVAVLDDSSEKDHDLLFSTEGIMQIVKGKYKDIVPYDDIELTQDGSIILHQIYSSSSINMKTLAELILSLRSKPYAEIKERKNPLELMAHFIGK